MDIHINAPFALLQERYLDIFIEQRWRPEIGLNASVLDNTPASAFASMAERFRDAGLPVTLHGPFVDLSAGTPDPEIEAVTRKRFSQVLDLIPVFRPRTLVCHAGYDWKRYAYFREAWMEKSLEIWTWMGRAVRDAGAMLVLENVYERGPDELLPLIELLAESAGVGFCLDVGHQSAFSETSLADWLAGMAPFIRQLHLHDNYGIRDDHLAPGQGIIDFPLLFDFLGRRGGKMPILTLEAHREPDVAKGLACLSRFLP